MEARVRATGHLEGTWAESVEILGVMLMLVVVMVGRVFRFLVPVIVM